MKTDTMDLAQLYSLSKKTKGHIEFKTRISFDSGIVNVHVENNYKGIPYYQIDTNFVIDKDFDFSSALLRLPEMHQKIIDRLIQDNS